MRGSLASSSAVGVGGAVAGRQAGVAGGAIVALASGVGVARAVGVGVGVALVIGVGVGVRLADGVAVADAVGVGSGGGPPATNANSVVNDDDSHGTCSPRVALMTPACVFRNACSALVPGARISRSNSVRSEEH